MWGGEDRELGGEATTFARGPLLKKFARSGVPGASARGRCRRRVFLLPPPACFIYLHVWEREQPDLLASSLPQRA
ncbi:unnamed protein product, partial [Amoebophrya sp. A120]|eukprot:GSA120T00025620001.1